MAETCETWLTTSEAVAALTVSERTLRRYADAGRIKARKVGKSVFYDITSYIDKELEKVAEEDKLVTSPFVAVIYDSRLEKTIRGQAVGAMRPSITFMTPGTRHVQPDGSSQMVWNLVMFSIGANLDQRLSPYPLITRGEFNDCLVQPACSRLVDSGVIKVFYPDETSIKYENSYRAYSHADAMELISSTYSIVDLDRYSLGEDRKIIIAAIAAQRLEIEQQLEFNKNNVINANDPRRNFKR